MQSSSRVPILRYFAQGLISRDSSNKNTNTTSGMKFSTFSTPASDPQKNPLSQPSMERRSEEAFNLPFSVTSLSPPIMLTLDFLKSTLDLCPASEELKD